MRPGPEHGQTRESPRALALSRCARPKLGARRWSAYTVLGFAGYGAANALAIALGRWWELTLADRLISSLVPPAAFVIAVAVATAIKGREWIVFYQAAFASLASAAGVAWIAGAQVGRVLDVTVLGIGTFLVLGRLGCFHVACCHGRPLRGAARWWRPGVVYGAAHVEVGFWPRWQGRALVPVQLIESAASALLVAAAIGFASQAGDAALIYGVGYSCARFALELWRGDPVRPFARGLSEAQWASLLVLAIAGAARPALATIVPLAVIGAAAAALIARRRARELLLPPHLHELDRLARAVLADPSHARRDSRLGVALSLHVLDDCRRDWILSSQHPAWSAATQQRIIEELWPNAELVPGRTPGVVHVIEAAELAAA
jgi:Prolipoprotein diacylglyceryl transferase